MSFDSFIHKYPYFHYRKFHWQILNNQTVQFEFEFEIEGLTKFLPKTEIQLSTLNLDNIEKESIDNCIFHIGLVEMISYWKATCSPVIYIHCGHLNIEQIDFWKDLIFNGLGEFRFLNQIKSAKENFVKIEIAKSAKSFSNNNKMLQKNVLIPIGGGKDSVVTLELLLQKYSNAYVYLLNPINGSKQICKIAGIKNHNIIIGKRQIDAELLQLNQNGYLNGHTPFSALLSFQTALISNLLNLKYIALSNESSANEGNVIWSGSIVNHQYSKTYEYENKFRTYSQKYLNLNFEYFSFLRPLRELQIAKIFSKFKKYHMDFRSCNKGQKTGVWCCNCSKCLFVWVMLAPYVSNEALIKIFGENLWEKSNLLETLKELAGLSGHKPFECVGTISEVHTALLQSILKDKNPDKKNILLETVKQWPLKPNSIEKNSEHHLPKPFLDILMYANS